MTANPRKRYELRLTNDYAGTPHRPVFPAQGERLTLGQIKARIRDFKRISGGCDIAYRITDPTTGRDIDAWWFMQSGDVVLMESR